MSLGEEGSSSSIDQLIFQGQLPFSFSFPTFPLRGAASHISPLRPMGAGPAQPPGPEGPRPGSGAHVLPPTQLDSGRDAEPPHPLEHLCQLQVAIGDSGKEPEAEKIISICSVIITLRKLHCCVVALALLQSCVL